MMAKCQINPPDEVERLLGEHQLLVAFFASRFSWRRLAKWDDLISYGKIGLREAAKRYNPARGKFSTYAAHWIRKYLFEAVVEQIRLVNRISLEDRVGPDGCFERSEVTADERALTPAQLLITSDVLARFNRAMAAAGLGDREKEIIVQRYGVDGDTEKTQKQIAKKMGLTPRRIGQIEKIAREKLESLPPNFHDFS